ncbi:aldehyde dehydrogenase family protein [Dactylosporangium sp. AC04546]|uniref:aldehyde dehydrogenase family protein n=1 Tax=Dactylosporangium sp. AC04546 TaxID=2862460 RepID=UPI001EDCF260|nr:aldehyde dehydrogenase family protein [Dactylosporangium sp. AC04546]WVK81469.1 aldehyde dehydrogenase family protein [Dactylosporangium sp. AC04546]
MTIARANPARCTEIVGHVDAVVRNIPDRVDDAVRDAHRAYRAWSSTPPDVRLAALSRAADAVESELDELATLMAREIGKPLADCRGEIGFAVKYLRWVLAHAPLPDRVVDDADGRLVVRYKPYGVVVAVTPWNAPVILAMLKIAPALAAGNTIIVKPSPLGPLTIDRVVRIMREYLPDGVLRALHGHAPLVAALTTHRLVRKVAFTGGETAGRAIATAAADQLIPTVMELGGNDPAVFLDDVVPDDAAMDRLVLASLATSGQVCMAAKRLYVPRALLAPFVSAYEAAARRVAVLGDPLAPGVTVGPMISAEARSRAADLLATARAADLVPLGSTAPDTDLTAGHFVAPFLAVSPAPDAALLREEQFAPLVPLVPYDTEAEVLSWANDDDLGLGASVWSADEERAFAFARELEAGFVFVNTHNRTGMSLRAPFGGVKRSGWGREYAEEGLAEYVQPCVIHAPGPFRPGGAGLPPGAYPS